MIVQHRDIWLEHYQCFANLKLHVTVSWHCMQNVRLFSIQYSRSGSRAGMCTLECPHRENSGIEQDSELPQCHSFGPKDLSPVKDW